MNSVSLKTFRFCFYFINFKFLQQGFSMEINVNYSATHIEITNAHQQVSYLKTHEKYSSTLLLINHMLFSL